MSARASRREPRLTGLTGGNWAQGRIELQAIQACKPAEIATMPCESDDIARAAAEHLIETRPDLVLVRIVRDGNVPGAEILLDGGPW